MTPDHEHGMIGVSGGAKGRPREPQSDARLERLRPAPVPGSPCAGPTLRTLPLQDQIGGDEAASRLEEPSEERTRDGVGRVGNDSKGASWQTEIRGIGLDHGDVVYREPPAKVRGPSRVQLDCDNTGTGGDQGSSHDPLSCAYVEHELPRADAGLGNETVSPGGVELPAPPAGAGGHGAPVP